jgi:tRNA-specific 2-thiouridylase
MYVIEISAKKNEIVLGTREDLEKKQMHLSSFNLIKYPNIENDIIVKTKIRYNTKAVKSTLSIKNNKITITFHEKVWAITPGQSAVFYDENDAVIGGGIIAK